MSCVKSLWFSLVVVSLSFVQCKEMCDLVDVQCMTIAARNVYRTAVDGIKGLVEPIDPLFIDDLEGLIPEPYLKYTIFNPKMTGLKDCHVTELVFQPDEVTFEYELYCPLLVLNYGYEGNGTYGAIKIDGKGQEKLTLNDYIIILKGQTERYIAKEDNKLRTYVKNFNVETKPKGQIKIEADNYVRGDKEKSDQAEAYVNEHAMDLEKYLRSPIIEKFMKVFIDRLNMIFVTFPYEEIIPKI